MITNIFFFFLQKRFLGQNLLFGPERLCDIPSFLEGNNGYQHLFLGQQIVWPKRLRNFCTFLGEGGGFMFFY